MEKFKTDTLFQVRINNINEINKVELGLKWENRTKFYFRGQNDAMWGFQTSLERYICKKFKDTFYKSFQKVTENNVEFEISEKIIRKLPVIIKEELGLSHRNHPIKNFAFLRHINAISRFLDFTEDFFTALYFAFNSKPHPTIDTIPTSEYVSIWVINAAPLMNKWSQKIEDAEFGGELVFSSAEELFYHLHLGDDFGDGISVYEPKVITDFNKRMNAQNGVLLFPLNLKKTFQEQIFDFEIKSPCTMPKFSTNNVNELIIDEFLNKADEIHNNRHKVEIFKLIIPSRLYKSLFKNHHWDIMYNRLYPDEKYTAIYEQFEIAVEDITADTLDKSGSRFR